MSAPNYSFSTHPHKILIILVIGGLTVLFLSFTIAYAYSLSSNELTSLRVPLVFYINTFVITGSSYTISKARRAFIKDQVELLKRNLLITIGLTMLFLAGQVFGWLVLLLQDIPLTHSVAASYVYIISALHMVHILAGIPFLIAFYLSTSAKLKGSVNTLLYFADANKRLRLNLIVTYWYFLDLVWIYLIIFFAGYYFL